MSVLRTPTSAPLAFTRNGTLSAGRPVLGSTLMMTPRTSLEWKPWPALRNSSVLSNGPRIRLPFGLAMKSCAEPELSGLLLSTLARYQSPRPPTMVRSHGVQWVVFWA